MKQHPVTRRNFLKILGATAAVGAAWGWGVRGWPTALEEVSISRILMGTLVNLTLVGESRAEAAAAASAALDEMGRLEGLLSRHRPDSELTRLNREGSLAHASRPLLALIQQSQQLSEQSDGAFDISVQPLLALYRSYQERGELPPAEAVARTLQRVGYKHIAVTGRNVRFSRPGMGITLDGIGKGTIIDAGTAVLRQHGFVNVLVEAGGDLMAAGEKGGGRGWQIGVQPPREGGQQTTFALHNQGVATSGDYMQPFADDLSQHHILDPRSGYSAAELASVTITAPSAQLADGLATAVMVLGVEAGQRLLEQYPNCAGLLLRKN